MCLTTKVNEDIWTSMMKISVLDAPLVDIVMVSGELVVEVLLSLLLRLGNVILDTLIRSTCMLSFFICKNRRNN